MSVSRGVAILGSLANIIAMKENKARQSQWKGKNYSLSFSEKAEKGYTLFSNVFLDMIFYPRVLY